MGLDYVTTPSINCGNNSNFTPLGYIVDGGVDSSMPRGGSNPSIFVPVIQQQQQPQNDGYGFWDFSKDVLKGAGQLLGGALYCGGAALATAGVAYNLAGPRFLYGGIFGRPCNVTYNINTPLAPAPGPILHLQPNVHARWTPQPRFFG